MEMESIKNDFELKKENIKSHHTAVQSGRQHKKGLSIWFDNWRKFTTEEKDIRERFEKVKDALDCKRGKTALKKWKERTDTTTKMRAFLRRGIFVKKQANLKTTFLAWKQEYYASRRFIHTMVNFADSMR